MYYIRILDLFIKLIASVNTFYSNGKVLDKQTNKSDVLIYIVKQNDLFGVVDLRINQQISQLNRLSLHRNFHSYPDYIWEANNPLANALKVLGNGQFQS